MLSRKESNLEWIVFISVFLQPILSRKFSKDSRKMGQSGLKSSWRFVRCNLFNYLISIYSARFPRSTIFSIRRISNFVVKIKINVQSKALGKTSWFLFFRSLLMELVICQWFVQILIKKFFSIEVIAVMMMMISFIFRW